MIKILLLEDDELFAESLVDFLEELDFDLFHVKDGEAFIAQAYENNFDLYLLDINVPKINGLASLDKIRSLGNNTPAIFLTSYKDKETLQEGFHSGCDDFLTKPFDMDELFLRIRSLLKRSHKIIETIQIDNIIFDPQNNTLSKDKTIIETSLKVIELFKLFYENNGKIVTKEMIIDRLWGYDEVYSDGSIRVYITKIQKLFDEKKITNIKNVGYKIDF